ncbi:MAG TPA: hypothetical protein VII66_09960 [Gemmatimonadaceae bacterium]
MRFRFVAFCLAGTVLTTSIAAAQAANRATQLYHDSGPYVLLSLARAGISRPPADATKPTGITSTHRDGRGHRVKHAAIGAGIGAAAGLVVGAALGRAADDRPGDGFIPATPVFAAEGLVIGLVAGFVVGAFIR